METTTVPSTDLRRPFRPNAVVSFCAPRSRINGCARSGARRFLGLGRLADASLAAGAALVS